MTGPKGSKSDDAHNKQGSENNDGTFHNRRAA
jgi:hypothetical protein